MRGPVTALDDTDAGEIAPPETGRNDRGPGSESSRSDDWKVVLREDLAQTLERGQGRWSRGLIAVAWAHLAAFLVCQAMYDPKVHSDPRMVGVWGLEFAVILIAMRALAGRRWFASSTSVGIVARLWGTFLILSFNLVSLNQLLGWDVRWYKPAWATLSTFFCASLAWLFTPRFFVPAVQMYFTALLMVAFPHEENLIYGVSWWLILLGTARMARRRGG